VYICTIVAAALRSEGARDLAKIDLRRWMYRDLFQLILSRRSPARHA
jgi:hypothetical protein